MTIKSGLLSGILVFSSLAMAAATKSYDIVISAPVMAGDVQLMPGEYKMRVEGSNAVFNGQNKKSFTVPVKVENGDRKFNSTALSTTKQGSSERLTSIELGGSKTQLQFGEK